MGILSHYIYSKPLKLKCMTVEVLTFKDYTVQSIWHTILKPCKHKFCIYVNLIMRVDWKLRVHSEHLLMWHLFFIIRNNISNEKREERSTFLYSHPEGSSTYRVLSGNICLKHRIWGFVNGTTVRKLLELRISLTSVTTKMLLQRGKKMEVI